MWTKIYGGTSVDIANAVSTDASGNIYITGYFNGTTDFDPGTGTFNLTAAGGNEVFVSKLDGSGNFIWPKQMGGTVNDEGSVIAVDAAGKVYVAGYFSGTADFDPGTGTFNLTSAGGADIFISKLNNAGNFICAKQFGGISTDNIRSIVVDNTGNVYTTGVFYGTSDFDPGAGTFNLTSPGSDIFISKLDASGNFIWAQQLGNVQGEQVYSIALDGSNNIYTAGTFYGTQDFDLGSGTSYLTAYGYPDLYIHKMSQCSFPSATLTPSGPITFCSGGSVVLNAPVASNRSYQWKKGANLISGATLQSYTATTGGNYKVTVANTVTGCSKTTQGATTVTVNALPAATITPQGPTTFCAGGSVLLKGNNGTGFTYQWKKGGTNIPGATLKNYTAITAGVYKVKVTNSSGCSKLSSGITVSVPCKEGEIISEEKGSFDVIVYPNPNSGEFTIKFSNKPSAPVQIEMKDELGKVVKRFETNDETILIRVC
ncbi:MAG: SBBP repeat-containing protein [Bacteroidia bacterium]